MKCAACKWGPCTLILFVKMRLGAGVIILLVACNCYICWDSPLVMDVAGGFLYVIVCNFGTGNLFSSTLVFSF
uniref:Uncharacterized protein n=1 Tax=Arundo donax TaxID=35708 RepID=A0A0A9A734_ARUDO